MCLEYEKGYLKENGAHIKYKCFFSKVLAKNNINLIELNE